MENLGGMAALNRSWSLTDHAFGKSFRAWTLSVLPWFLIILFTRGLPWWGRMIADFAGIALFPLPSTYLTLLYVELRYRKDGVSLFTLPAAHLSGPGRTAPGADGSAPAGDA
jgi:hypothetical protein